MNPEHLEAILQQLEQAREFMRQSIHPATMCQCPQVRETPLTTLHRVWRQVAPEDRLRFLVEMLTPNERRALQFGFDDVEEGA